MRFLAPPGRSGCASIVQTFAVGVGGPAGPEPSVARRDLVPVLLDSAGIQH